MIKELREEELQEQINNQDCIDISNVKIISNKSEIELYLNNGIKRFFLENVSADKKIKFVLKGVQIGSGGIMIENSSLKSVTFSIMDSDFSEKSGKIGKVHITNSHFDNFSVLGGVFSKLGISNFNLEDSTINGEMSFNNIEGVDFFKIRSSNIKKRFSINEMSLVEKGEMEVKYNSLYKIKFNEIYNSKITFLGNYLNNKNYEGKEIQLIGLNELNLKFENNDLFIKKIGNKNLSGDILIEKCKKSIIEIKQGTEDKIGILHLTKSTFLSLGIICDTTHEPNVTKLKIEDSTFMDDENNKFEIRRAFIEDFSFISFSNYAKETFFNGVKINKFEIFNSNLGKSVFNNLVIGKVFFSGNEISQCLFNNLRLGSYKFAETGSTVNRSTKDKLELKEGYRQFKYILEKNGNYTEANKFYVEEMEAFGESLNWKNSEIKKRKDNKSLKIKTLNNLISLTNIVWTRIPNPDKLIFETQKYTSNFGQNWFLVSLYLIIFSITFSLIDLCFSGKSFISLWELYLGGPLTIKGDEINLFRIFYLFIYSYLGYQLVISLRRQTKR